MTASARPKLYDISPLISPRIGVFPGDVPFRRDVAMDFAKGDHLLLSAIQTTLHLGAHADGPNHYTAAQAVGIGARDPWLYLGDCLVLHATVPRAARVGREHLKSKWRESKSWPTPRILVATGSFPDPDRWNSDFCSFSPRLIDEWGAAGVRLIGIDTPSIDPEAAKDLESHHAVAKHDMAVLEGLVLDGVPEGVYTLIALPLKLEGADASPVRAVLLEHGGIL